MAFAQANGVRTQRLGSYFMESLRDIAQRSSEKIEKVEGLGHLAGVHFKTLENAAAAAKAISGSCVDTSAQLYKPNCPPAVLFKPPLTASEAVLSYIAQALEKAL